MLTHYQKNEPKLTKAEQIKQEKMEKFSKIHLQLCRRAGEIGRQIAPFRTCTTAKMARDLGATEEELREWMIMHEIIKDRPGIYPIGDYKGGRLKFCKKNRWTWHGYYHIVQKYILNYRFIEDEELPCPEPEFMQKYRRIIRCLAAEIMEAHKKIFPKKRKRKSYGY